MSSYEEKDNNEQGKECATDKNENGIKICNIDSAGKVSEHTDASICAIGKNPIKLQDKGLGYKFQRGIEIINQLLKVKHGEEHELSIVLLEYFKNLSQSIIGYGSENEKEISILSKELEYIIRHEQSNEHQESCVLEERRQDVLLRLKDLLRLEYDRYKEFDNIKCCADLPSPCMAPQSRIGENILKRELEAMTTKEKEKPTIFESFRSRLKKGKKK